MEAVYRECECGAIIGASNGAVLAGALQRHLLACDAVGHN